jgi:hypothetical protein
MNGFELKKWYTNRVKEVREHFNQLYYISMDNSDKRKGGYQLDHILPVHACICLGFPKERINHPKNLIYIHEYENTIKLNYFTKENVKKFLVDTKDYKEFTQLINKDFDVALQLMENIPVSKKIKDKPKKKIMTDNKTISNEMRLFLIRTAINEVDFNQKGVISRSQFYSRMTEFGMDYSMVSFEEIFKEKVERFSFCRGVFIYGKFKETT